MKINDDLGRKIEALMPKSLDDIMRLNREHMTIRLATDREVMELHHEIAPDHTPEMIIDDWRLVAFEMSVDDFHRLEISLLGDKPYGGVWITSHVRKIDLDHQLLITRSGTLYRLGKPGDGEPPFDHLAMICATAHSWGWGAVFGIPHFVY